MNVINKLILWVKTRIRGYEYFNGFYYPKTVGYDKHTVANMLKAGVSFSDICSAACGHTTKCDGVSCKKCMFGGYGRIVLLEFLQHEGLVDKKEY